MSGEYNIDTFETHQHRQVENVIEELDEDANSKTADSPIVTITVSLPADRHHTITNTELRGYCSTTNTFLWTTSGVIFVVAYYTSLWIALWPTSGIIFVVAYLLRLSKHATKTHWDILIGALRRLKTIIEPLSDIKQQATVAIIADSDWAHDRVDSNSYSGSCVLVDGALVNFVKQPNVATEYISTSDACTGGLHFRNLLDKLIFVILIIGAWMDNIGAGCIAQYVINNNRTNSDVKYRTIRNWISKGIFELFYIERSKNIVDVFTKTRPAHAHRGLAHRLLSGISFL
jgi:hypothetical protein